MKTEMKFRMLGIGMLLMAGLSWVFVGGYVGSAGAGIGIAGAIYFSLQMRRARDDWLNEETALEQAFEGEE